MSGRLTSHSIHRTMKSQCYLRFGKTEIPRGTLVRFPRIKLYNIIHMRSGYA